MAATNNSWGRLDNPHHTIRIINTPQQAREIIQSAKPGLPYGNGRSYGDACLNPNGILWDMKGLNQFISFNDQTGKLRCEAGVLLKDIQQLMIPRGWMLPVVPSTLNATVGGAIATDIHGKNQHILGSFGNYVSKITLLRTDGECIECGTDIQPEWFAATIGGIGLTGVIVAAELQLQRVDSEWFEIEYIPFKSLREFASLDNESASLWNYTSAWLNCLHNGKGIYLRGNPKSGKKSIGTDKTSQYTPHSLSIPLTPPFSCINALSLPLINAIYSMINSREKGLIERHYTKVLAPMDSFPQWNRIYGKKGFFQYQCVVPKQGGLTTINEMLCIIQKDGGASPFTSLKVFGKKQSQGMMSFARAGVSLTVDLPNRKERTLHLLAKLNDKVRAVGGAIYFAKDAIMPKDMLWLGYPRLDEFLKYRDKGISSAMSQRLIDN